MPIPQGLDPATAAMIAAQERNKKKPVVQPKPQPRPATQSGQAGIPGTSQSGSSWNPAQTGLTGLNAGVQGSNQPKPPTNTPYPGVVQPPQVQQQQQPYTSPPTAGPTPTAQGANQQSVISAPYLQPTGLPSGSAGAQAANWMAQQYPLGVDIYGRPIQGPPAPVNYQYPSGISAEVAGAIANPQYPDFVPGPAAAGLPGVGVGGAGVGGGSQLSKSNHGELTVPYGQGGGGGGGGGEGSTAATLAPVVPPVTNEANLSSVLSNVLKAEPGKIYKISPQLQQALSSSGLYGNLLNILRAFGITDVGGQGLYGFGTDFMIPTSMPNIDIDSLLAGLSPADKLTLSMMFNTVFNPQAVAQQPASTVTQT
jgi:hypothetical protein